MLQVEYHCSVAPWCVTCYWCLLDDGPTCYCCCLTMGPPPPPWILPPPLQLGCMHADCIAASRPERNGAVASSRVERFPVGEKINWQIGEMVGAGAFGRVYLGLNNDTGQLMAVKQVRGLLKQMHCSMASAVCLTMDQHLALISGSLHHTTPHHTTPHHTTPYYTTL